MKKTKLLLTSLVLLSMTIGFVGCSKETNGPAVPDATPTSVAEVATNTLTPGESTVAPTVVPEMTVTPNVEIVTPTQAPTAEATSTPAEMEVTKAPKLTETPAPTEDVAPTTTAAPIENIKPTEAPTATPKPANTPVPTSTPKPTVTPAPTATPKPTAIPTPEIFNGITVNDYVLFGTYEQDADLTNGKEPIEWLVLDVKDSKAFLLSKYVLEWMPFDTNYNARDAFEAAVAGNPSDYHCTWEASTIRTWLNDDFYKEAFDAEERGDILLSKVENLPNRLRGASSGPDTKDKVYLLSESEAIQYFGEYYTIFSDDNRPIWMGETVPEQTNQLSEPTRYTLAENRGIKQGATPGEWDDAYCRWSLRTTGGFGSGCVDVRAHGFLDQDGGFADGYGGIRPCLWIDLKTTNVEKTK